MWRVGTARHTAEKIGAAGLCQGTTLVVPDSCIKEHGFSRCIQRAGLKARFKREPPARLKACPVTNGPGAGRFDLSPISGHPDVTSVARRPVSRHPHDMRPGRHDVSSGDPHVGSVMPAVIATGPDVARPGCDRDDFTPWRRRRHSNHRLCKGSLQRKQEPKCGCQENPFHLVTSDILLACINAKCAERLRACFANACVALTLQDVV